ncbi:MAG: hypothetical protein HY518_04325 [Candidatus Aenigmarchaeota archaeon]|nr:hypothetical protein [Candidatus Aenigmarchaeota archaeon]
MPDILIGVHAALGELAILASLWVFVELLNPSQERVKRAKIGAIAIVVFLFASWVAGGTYYVNTYGPSVKPIIKAGPQPWAHAIFTETKEHVFLFLPFMSILLLAIISRYGAAMLKDRSMQYAALALSLAIFLIALSMVGMGYVISTGVRAGLEAGAV